MSREALVDGFALTKSWLQDQIERKHGVRPRVGKVEPLGADAVGYMSVIRRVHLEWDSAQSQPPKSVIVKIPCATASNDAVGSSDSSGEFSSSYERVSHALETNFYRLLQDGKQTGLLAPIIYAAKDYDSEQPVIVMEDYNKCFVVDLVEGFSEKQLFAIADQIANLHAFSIRNRQCFSVLLADGKSMLNELTTVVSSQARSMCHKLMEDMPELFSRLKIFLVNTMDKDPDWMFKVMEQYFSGERPFVLTHGDLWSAQILWRNKNTIAGIVDWQGVHQGSPLEDFLRLTNSSTTVENRRGLLHPLLDYYHSKMTEQLGTDMPFSREYLNEELKYLAPWNCMLNIFDSTVWMNSNMVKLNGEPSAERRNEIARRCAAIVEDTIKLCGW